MISNMLQELRIENVAVIEHAEILFGPGLNVMTGETGAGKSIVIDSIAAVTGSRVSRDLIRSGAERATVTAVFDRAPADDWLRENDIDTDEENLILQRRISADGKSSCRVCGYPVSAAQLKSLGMMILEIHGQNDGLQLLDERKHLTALDRFAGLNLDHYRDHYHRLCEMKRERERLSINEEEKERLQEQLSDYIAELERMQVRSGEQDELSSKRELLRNSEKLMESLHAARNALDSENGALASAQDASWQCRRAAAFSDDLMRAVDSLEQAVFLLADAGEILQDFEESMDFSPEEYDRLEQRLRELSRLERKYRRPADELPAFLDECRNRLNEISFSEEKLKKLNSEIDRQDQECRHLADELHKKRLQAAGVLSKRIEQELKDLSMPSATFIAEVILSDDLSETGCDSVRFLLSANRGEAPGRISRIASGGELSRIMLAMKNVLSRDDPIPTMIFDEIDTGVSGVAAQRVGEKLADLSLRKQVLCVTHLPQLASMADSHFVIEKHESGNRTLTSVQLLDREGRRRELARLHGGDYITQTTLRSAEEQLHYAENYKSNSSNKSTNERIKGEE